MDDKKTVIMVTGGSGLVGKNLEQLVKHDHLSSEKFIFLSSHDANLQSPEDVREIFKKIKPDVVIHLAANVGGLFKNMRQNLSILKSNMNINENVLGCAFEYNVKKVISCLSTCIFPDKITYPIDETMVHNGPPNDSNYGYSYSKRYIEILNRAYNEVQNGSMFTSIIPCNIYGPFDNFHLEDGHVVPSLIHKAYLAKQNKIPLEVLGSGKPLRQFIFAPDLAKLILNVMREYNSPSPIILCTDESDEISIGNVAEHIRKAIKIEDQLIFNPSFADGQFKKTASNKKLREFWPDFKFTSFAQGINETVCWFEKNYSQARR